MIISVVKPFSLYIKWSKKKKKISKLTLGVFATTKEESGKDKKELVEFKLKNPTKDIIYYLSHNIFDYDMGNLKQTESISTGNCADCFICTDEDFSTLYGIALTTSLSSKVFIIEENEELKTNPFINFETVIAYHNEKFMEELTNYKKLKIKHLSHFALALFTEKLDPIAGNNLALMLTECYNKPFTDNAGVVWSSIFKPEDYGFTNSQLEALKVFEIRKLKGGIRISSKYIQNIL